MAANLSKVQWLTVGELAELWAPELAIPKSIVVQELRLALYKLDKSGLPLNDQLFCYEKFKQQLSNRPEDHELPAPSRTIDREFVKAFCGKEIWHLPSFWFEKQTNQPSFPGRPSIMAAIQNELNNLAASGKLEPMISTQAEILHTWAKDNFPADQIPTIKTIENGIRLPYSRLKAAKTKSTK